MEGRLPVNHHFNDGGNVFFLGSRTFLQESAACADGVASVFMVDGIELP